MDEATRRSLMDAGAAAIRFNAPLGRARVDELVEFVSAHGHRVVDLGCGAGALVIELAARLPELEGHGVDLAPAVIERARAAATRSAVADRVRFSVGDVVTDAEPADVAICIGSTHAFGSPEVALDAIRTFGMTAAIVADGIWATEPTAEHVELFGELPAGEDALAALARSAGWSVVEQSRSSIEEWDEFELGWIGGVRDVGTVEAVDFAEHRLQDYQNYRGVLGFGWLLLTR